MSEFIIRKLINIKETKVKKKIKKVYTYEYLNSKKKTLNNNKDVIAYTKLWRIPPAYPEVKIFLNVNDKKDNTCYAVGTDEKGRTQHLYTSHHTIVSDKQKYCKILEVGKNYEKIFTKLNKDLRKKTVTKNKLIAILLKIMIECQFRPGHEKYKKEYGSIGLTTLQRKHIFLKNNKTGGQNNNTNRKKNNTNNTNNMNNKNNKNKNNKNNSKNNSDKYLKISFIGKKGVLNECTLRDVDTIKALMTLIKGKKPEENVFEYKKIKIKPTDINSYLPGKITAKNIRTWDANLEFINFSKKLDEPLNDKESVLKKQLKEVVEQVAKKLHHSPAICKKSYLDTDLFTMFIEKPDKFTKLFLKKNSSSNKSLIDFFQKKCNVN